MIAKYDCQAVATHRIIHRAVLAPEMKSANRTTIGSCIET